MARVIVHLESQQILRETNREPRAPGIQTFVLRNTSIRGVAKMLRRQSRFGLDWGPVSSPQNKIDQCICRSGGL